ncbi:MAG: hypothetical protein KA436_04995 [Oligoflexales bacterium]|nr:hypothetical protein [Oligoflexales bacterium]
MPDDSKPAKKEWSNKTCVIFGNSASTLSSLQQVSLPQDWRVTKICTSVESLLLEARKQSFSFIIVDDTLELPVLALVRKLLLQPVLLSFPIICFLMEHRAYEKDVLVGLTYMDVVPKPFRPVIFVKAFQNLITKWETPPFYALRLGMAQYLKMDKVQSRIEILVKLTQLEDIKKVAIPCLAYELYSSSFPHKAEELLLEAVQRYPQHLASTVFLGDLYMRWAMPLVANRFFLSLSRRFPKSLFLYPDCIQALYLMNRFEAALELLQIAFKKGYFLAEIIPVYLHCLFAENKHLEAERIGASAKSIFKKIAESWDFESPNT